MNSPGKCDDLKNMRLFSGSTSTGKWKISREFRTFVGAWIRNWGVGVVSRGSKVRKYGREVVNWQRSSEASPLSYRGGDCPRTLGVLAYAGRTSRMTSLSDTGLRMGQARRL